MIEEGKGLLKTGLGKIPLGREHTHNVNSTMWRQEKDNLNHVGYACNSAQ